MTHEEYKAALLTQFALTGKLTVHSHIPTDNGWLTIDQIKRKPGVCTRFGLTFDKPISGELLDAYGVLSDNYVRRA